MLPLQEVLETAYELFIKQSQYHDALRVALRMGNEDAIPTLFAQCSEDKLMKKQMCLLLARQRINYEIEDDDDDEATELNELIGNEKLSEEYLKVAQDLDVMDPKTPEDIYKSHLAETGGFSRRRDTGAVGVDSARANLASTYVNAFVNAGFGQDKVRVNFVLVFCFVRSGLLSLICFRFAADDSGQRMALQKQRPRYDGSRSIAWFDSALECRGGPCTN